MARAERLIRMAYIASYKADTSCNFALGAVVALGNKVISIGACSTKTHPLNPKIRASTMRDQLCAEIVTILKAYRITSPSKVTRCDIYIARRRKDGSVGIAKPCKHCQKFLRETGIRKVFYTTNSGDIQQLGN